MGLHYNCMKRKREFEFGDEGVEGVDSLAYYHCADIESSFVSLVSDVFIVLLCSLAILGLLFRHINISSLSLSLSLLPTYILNLPIVPVDPLEWQISQDTANSIFAGLANTIGAAESVLRVATTGHDKILFLKVVVCLYLLSTLGRLVSGVTVAYTGLCLFCLYMLAENSQLISSWFLQRSDPANLVQDNV
ncbi:Reticulon-like protein [Actinidia chinensis var. chinensis]|uniref:Reticulon-like protein n=1 Tax=Actinidia chinensis var. chinensis TaxID=1590841 RepID=A0A2R6PV63_ACTCC|nr:Reticulon-like protein [Actinidia chinensis var. chinensis]